MKAYTRLHKILNGNVIDEKIIERDLLTFPYSDQGDAALRNSVTNLPSVTVPTQNRTSPFKAIASVHISKGLEYFTEIEIVLKPDGYYLYEQVIGNYYGQYPRKYYLDHKYIGTDLTNFGPFKHGGLYCLTVRSWNPAKPDYGHIVGGSDFNDMKMHVVWIIIPGKLGEAGATKLPSTFKLSKLYLNDITQLIPPFSALPNKIMATYQYGYSENINDYYARGSTHATNHGMVYETNPAKIQTTTGFPISGYGYENIDAMGEQVFRQLTRGQLDSIVNNFTPNVDILFTDFEKTEDYGQAGLYWGLGLEDLTLPNYYYFLRAIRQKYPTIKVADYYRNMIFNRGFLNEGNPNPTHSTFINHYTNPSAAIKAPYRSFSFEENGNTSTVSLRDVINLYSIDCYPGSSYHTNDGQNQFLMQPYSLIHDTRIMKKLIGSNKVIWFAWDGTDTEFSMYRHYQRVSNGWVWRNLRLQPPAWYCMYVGLFGSLLSDGVHWWHDQVPARTDPNLVLFTPDGTGWEPDVAGTPSPIPSSYNNVHYPREYRMGYIWSKVGEYLASTFASILAGGFTVHDAPFKFAEEGQSLPSSFTTDHGEPEILYRASSRIPIVIELRGQTDSVIIACYPFGSPLINYKGVAQVRGTLEKAFTLTGQWPTALNYLSTQTVSTTQPITTQPVPTTIPTTQVPSDYSWLQLLGYTYDAQSKGMAIHLKTTSNNVQVSIEQSINGQAISGNGWNSLVDYTPSTVDAIPPFTLRRNFSPNPNFTGGVYQQNVNLRVKYNGITYLTSFIPEWQNDVPVYLKQ